MFWRHSVSSQPVSFLTVKCVLCTQKYTFAGQVTSPKWWGKRYFILHLLWRLSLKISSRSPVALKENLTLDCKCQLNRGQRHVWIFLSKEWSVSWVLVYFWEGALELKQLPDRYNLQEKIMHLSHNPDGRKGCWHQHRGLGWRMYPYCFGGKRSWWKMLHFPHPCTLDYETPCSS